MGGWKHYVSITPLISLMGLLSSGFQGTPWTHRFNICFNNSQTHLNSGHLNTYHPTIANPRDSSTRRQGTARRPHWKPRALGHFVPPPVTRRPYWLASVFRGFHVVWITGSRFTGSFVFFKQNGGLLESKLMESNPRFCKKQLVGFFCYKERCGMIHFFWEGIDLPKSMM